MRTCGRSLDRGLQSNQDDVYTWLQEHSQSGRTTSRVINSNTLQHSVSREELVDSPTARRSNQQRFVLHHLPVDRYCCIGPGSQCTTAPACSSVQKGNCKDNHSWYVWLLRREYRRTPIHLLGCCCFPRHMHLCSILAQCQVHLHQKLEVPV